MFETKANEIANDAERDRENKKARKGQKDSEQRDLYFVAIFS